MDSSRLRITCFLDRFNNSIVKPASWIAKLRDRLTNQFMEVFSRRFHLHSQISIFQQFQILRVANSMPANLNVYCLIITFTRGAWIGLFIGLWLFAFLVVLKQARWKKLTVIAVGLAIIVTIFRHKESVDIDKVNLMKW